MLVSACDFGSLFAMSLEPHNHDDASSSSSMNLASSSSGDSSIGDTREFVVYERDLLLHLSSSPRVQDAQRSLPLAPLKQWYSELLADPNHVAHNANVHQGGAGRESGGHHPRQNRRVSALSLSFSLSLSFMLLIQRV